MMMHGLANTNVLEYAMWSSCQPFATLIR